MSNPTIRSVSSTRLDEGIAAYLDARQAGQDVDIPALLAQFPDVREPLANFIANENPVIQALGVNQPKLASFGRYLVLGPIGQGGVGAVFRARDTELQREVAIKVLHTDLAYDPALVTRFIEEAQIAAQLQHPGIVPVHDVGKLPDGRPYFTMRYVKGETLHALLRDRGSTTDDLMRFLNIFEQVCQTLAFAHHRSVLHRDLKPGNIMVFGFGEVLVMDWGLGKVLVRVEQGEPQPSAQTEPAHSVICIDHQGTRLGSVMGTPAYMPPEQARGEIHLVDKRSDVFGLGAVLCEILTGAPVYVGATVEELKEQAREGATADALGRLRKSGADAALIGLACDCLEVAAVNRPADAKAVADRMAGYLGGIRDSLRRTELERAAAEARLAEERKQKWVSLLLMGLVSLALLLGGLVFVVLDKRWGDSQRTWANQAEVTLKRAELLADDAEKAARQDANRTRPEHIVTLWEKAAREIEEVQHVAESLGKPDLRRSLQKVQSRIQSGLERARREVQLIAALEKVLHTSATRGGAFEVEGKPPTGYLDVLREHGLDVNNPEAFHKTYDGLTGLGKERVIAALDHWALLDATRQKPLYRLLAECDDDPWRSEVRRRAQQGKSLRELADNSRTLRATASGLLLLARALSEAREPEAAARVLRGGARRFPDHFWLNLELGNAVLVLPRASPGEAVACYRAAVALAPESPLAWNNLGRALGQIGQREEAEFALTRAESLARQQGSRFATPIWTLGLYRLILENDFRGAESAARQALLIDPGDPRAKALAGAALVLQSKDAEQGSALVNKARREAPDDPSVLYCHLQASLALDNIPDAQNDAARLCRAVGGERTGPGAVNKVLEHILAGDSPRAIAAANRAFADGLPSPPWYQELHHHRGLALTLLGRHAEAEKDYRDVLKDMRAWRTELLLALTVMRQGRIKEGRDLVVSAQQLYLEQFPGMGPPALMDWLMSTWVSISAEVDEYERSGREPAVGTRLLAGEIALARGKAYTGYRLLEKSGRLTSPEKLLTLLPSGFFSDKGLLRMTYRFNRARAALGASCGPDASSPRAALNKRPELRKEALALLREEIEVEVDRKKERLEEHHRLVRWLNYCSESPEFAAVRPPASQTLPKAEQEEWGRFWSEVATRLRELRER